MLGVAKKPRYVHEDICTACRLCEFACPVDIPADFDCGMGSTRAIRVPFSTAVPQAAVLEMEHCILCGKCQKVCPVDGCIDFTQKEELFDIHAGAIVLATGFEITPRDAKKEYGDGKLQNVIDGLMMERLLAPTGPYGHVIRPGDGKEPESISLCPMCRLARCDVRR